MKYSEANFLAKLEAGYACSFCDELHSDEDRREMRAGRRRYERELWGEALYVMLRCGGWLATTILTTAGLFIALFFAAGNLTLAGFFEQIALLSTRYGEVTPLNRSEFDANLTIVIALTFIATAFFRRATLIGIFTTGGVDGPRTDAHA